MKASKLLILLFVIVVGAIFYWFFLKPANKNNDSEKQSDSQKLLNQIENFNINKLDNLLKKIEAMKKHGDIPVKEAQQTGRANPFVPF